MILDVKISDLTLRYVPLKLKPPWPEFASELPAERPPLFGEVSANF
jgi:hypothetical protein